MGEERKTSSQREREGDCKILKKILGIKGSEMRGFDSHLLHPIIDIYVYLDGRKRKNKPDDYVSKFVSHFYQPFVFFIYKASFFFVFSA